MKDYIKALKEIENEDKTFELTLSKKEVLDLVKEIERLNTDKEQLNSLVNFNQKEIRRLHSIIKEVRELLESDYFEDGSFNNYEKVFELLDKV